MKIPYYNGKRLKLILENEIFSKKDSLVALNFGNSHTCAINFKSLNLYGKGVGYGGGGDLSEIKYQLEYIVPKLPNLKYVFITMSYFQPYTNNLAASNGDMVDTRIANYYAIPPSFNYIIKQKDFKNYIASKIIPFISEKALIDRNIIDKLTAMNILDKAPDIKNIWIPDTTKIMAKVIAHQLLYHEKTLRYLPNVLSFNLDIACDIAHYLYSRNIKLIFYTPPYYYLYTKYYQKKYLADHKKFMGDLMAKTSITYFNLSTDSSFIYNPFLFNDQDHLNEAGAILFSEKLKCNFEN